MKSFSWSVFLSIVLINGCISFACLGDICAAGDTNAKMPIGVYTYLSNLRKNNRIYLKIIASKPGLFLKGEEMPNLPPTMKSMFSSPRAAASAPTELNKSTLSEYQLRVPHVFKGAALIPIKIRR